MELRHLRYFITVAEELHFGRAAERLHIAQPPLSQQIRQLEAELGFQLFNRTSRTVQLTEAGKEFLKECRQILQQLEQAVQIGRQISRGELGQLVIGFASSSAYNVLPSILQTFRAEVQSVRLELLELTTVRQLQWLETGRIDVGFVRPPVDIRHYHAKTVFQESFVVALPDGHPLTDREEVSVRSLANEPFVLFSRSQAPGLYDQIISFCQQAGFSPHVTQEAGLQMQTIISLVAAGMGVALVPSSLQNLQRIGVVYKPVQEPTPQAEMTMIWRKDDLSPILQRFLGVVEQVIH
jgi:DNA-binding transcriptional LysR family regulator